MNKHLTSASLKSLAKGQLLGKYGTVIGAFAIHMACIFGASASAFVLVDTTSFIGSIIYYAATFIISLLNGLFACGEAYLYLKIACNQKPVIGDLFYGFQNVPEKVLRIQLVLSVISTVCGLPNMLSLLVAKEPDNPYFLLLYVVLFLIGTVANVILSLTFSMSYYLMLDFPDHSPREILKMSYRVMKGNKGRLFYIELSFLPLMLLGFCSCCVTYLWLFPYIQAAKANFYLDLMKKR